MKWESVRRIIRQCWNKKAAPFRGAAGGFWIGRLAVRLEIVNESQPITDFQEPAHMVSGDAVTTCRRSAATILEPPAVLQDEIPHGGGGRRSQRTCPGGSPAHLASVEGAQRIEGGEGNNLVSSQGI